MLRRYLLLGLLMLLILPLELAEAASPVLSQSKTMDKLIALTFDDGWDNNACERVRQILTEHGVVATLFPVGTWAASNRAVIENFLADGHELGNHSMTHPKLTMLSLAQQEQELREAQAVLARTGREQLTDFIRPPYGAYDQNTLRAAAKLSLRPVTWSIDSWDWRDIPVQQVVKRTLESAKPGGVILMHLAGRNTVEALPPIITGLKEQGYTFLPLSRLFAGQTVTAPSVATKQVKVTYRGELLQLEPAAKLIDGVTYVPCREFLQRFGWLVRWDAQQQLAVCQLANAQILVQQGSGSAMHGLAGRLEGGKLYVPLRAIAGELGLKLGWNAAACTASLR